MNTGALVYLGTIALLYVIILSTYTSQLGMRSGVWVLVVPTKYSEESVELRLDYGVAGWPWRGSVSSVSTG